MKKIMKLTENDLTRLVKRVIKEVYQDKAVLAEQPGEDAGEFAYQIAYAMIRKTNDISKLVELYHTVENTNMFDNNRKEILLRKIYKKYVMLGGETEDDEDNI